MTVNSVSNPDMRDGNRTSGAASARLDGDVLHLFGRLDRHAVPALWPALPNGGYARLDLAGVGTLDTAGLALIAELAARATAAKDSVILNPPGGYAELCAAYRISSEPN